MDIMIQMQSKLSPNMNITISHNHSMKQEQQRLIEMAAANRQRVIRNNLYLISILNSFTILIFIFSMSFYQWSKISFQVDKNITQTIWINLLYVYSTKYMGFKQYSADVCLSVEDICSSILDQFSFVGTFCFIIFLIAHVLQSVDVLVFVWKVCRKIPLTASNFFRQVFIICTFSYGIGVYIFSMGVIKNVNSSKYGICFYLTIISVCLSIAVVVYEQISIRKMMKAELVLELLEGQKQFDEGQADKYVMNRNTDSFVL